MDYTNAGLPILCIYLTCALPISFDGILSGLSDSSRLMLKYNLLLQFVQPLGG